MQKTVLVIKNIFKWCDLSYRQSICEEEWLGIEISAMKGSVARVAKNLRSVATKQKRHTSRDCVMKKCHV
jgi:hypothetical protein